MPAAGCPSTLTQVVGGAVTHPAKPTQSNAIGKILMVEPPNDHETVEQPSKSGDVPPDQYPRLKHWESSTGPMITTNLEAWELRGSRRRHGRSARLPVIKHEPITHSDGMEPDRVSPRLKREPGGNFVRENHQAHRCRGDSAASWRLRATILILDSLRSFASFAAPSTMSHQPGTSPRTTR